MTAPAPLNPRQADHDAMFLAFMEALTAELPRQPMRAAAACLLTAAMLARVPASEFPLEVLIASARAQWRMRGQVGRLIESEWPRRIDRIEVPRESVPEIHVACERMMASVMQMAREGRDVSGWLAVLMALAAKLYETSLSACESMFVRAVREAEERVGGWFEVAEVSEAA